MPARLLLLLLMMVMISTTVMASNSEPITPFGINGCAWSHLGMNTENFDRDAGLKRLRALKEAGVQIDRCDLWWGRIEPEPGKFVWRDVDWIVQQYREAGIQLMPILCYGSAWQKSDAPVTDEERQLYARYVYETVNRYKQDIHVWEIWNEPNILPFWSPTPDAREYAKLLKLAYEAAKKADPTCTVVGASTAGTDLAFIESLLLAGGGEYMDVVSIHPYQGDLGSLSPDRGGLAAQVRGVQKLLAEYGYRKPIWITEMGHRTPGTEGHTWVTEDQQAAYLVRSYVIAQAAGAERIFWFNLQDWEEYWGLIRQDFEPKRSFDAYRTMVEHLDGRRPIGTVEMAAGRVGYIFARGVSGGESADPVVVSWVPEDDSSMPGFSTRASRETVQPLPAPPPVSKRRHAELKPPPLPEHREAWHDPESSHRFISAFALAAPITDATPLVIPADRVPADVRDAREFAIFEAETTDRRIGQWDLDRNIVFLAPASDQSTRVFYIYGAGSESAGLDQREGALSNGLLTVHIRDGESIEVIELSSGYRTHGDQTDGLFAASYQDTAGGWPRTGTDTRVIEQKRISGAVLAQHRSRLVFGKDDCEFEFTVTVYAGLPRVSYAGRWLSPGAGASKQVNLGDTYPAGSVVTGMYGQATLPAAGVGYGPACVVRPSDHPTVTAVMVSPSGRLNTPGWATRAVVGAGLFYQTEFPAAVQADYFWYESIPEGELSAVAREHFLRCAPTAVSVGPAERR